MRYWLRIAAFLLACTGSIWILQGINLLPGSFMTGDMHWAYRGALLALAGAMLWMLSLCLAKPARRENPTPREKQ